MTEPEDIDIQNEIELCCNVFAQVLGVESDEKFFPELLVVAKHLLYLLPEGWEVVIGQSDLNGIPIFYNTLEAFSQWSHPFEEGHKQTIIDQRLELEKADEINSAQAEDDIIYSNMERKNARPISANRVVDSPVAQNMSFISEIEMIFAQLLGVDTAEDNAFQLIFLAKELLYSLPDGWEVVSGQSDMGIIPYFFDTVNQQSYWTHPYEEDCKQIVDAQREELNRTKAQQNDNSKNSNNFVNLLNTAIPEQNEQDIHGDVHDIQVYSSSSGGGGHQHSADGQDESGPQTIENELTELDILFAQVLGVDVDNERHSIELCLLAKELLYELPDTWEISLTHSADLGSMVPVFYDNESQASYWTHPLEAAHKEKIAAMRQILATDISPRAASLAASLSASVEGSPRPAAAEESTVEAESSLVVDESDADSLVNKSLEESQQEGAEVGVLSLTAPASPSHIFESEEQELERQRVAGLKASDEALAKTESKEQHIDTSETTSAKVVGDKLVEAAAEQPIEQPIEQPGESSKQPLVSDTTIPTAKTSLPLGVGVIERFDDATLDDEEDEIERMLRANMKLNAAGEDSLPKPGLDHQSTASSLEIVDYLESPMFDGYIRQEQEELDKAHRESERRVEEQELEASLAFELSLQEKFRQAAERKHDEEVELEALKALAAEQLAQDALMLNAVDVATAAAVSDVAESVLAIAVEETVVATKEANMSSAVSEKALSAVFEEVLSASLGTAIAEDRDTVEYGIKIDALKEKSKEVFPSIGVKVAGDVSLFSGSGTRLRFEEETDDNTNDIVEFDRIIAPAARAPTMVTKVVHTSEKKTRSGSVTVVTLSPPVAISVNTAPAPEISTQTDVEPVHTPTAMKTAVVSPTHSVRSKTSSGNASSPVDALLTKRIIKVKTDYLKMLRSNKITDSKLSKNVSSTSPEKSGQSGGEDSPSKIKTMKKTMQNTQRTRAEKEEEETKAMLRMGLFKRLAPVESICEPKSVSGVGKWHLLGSYDIHKEAVRSRQVIVHIVNTDSFGTILINPRDNFSDAYLAAELAEEERERQMKTMFSHTASTTSFANSYNSSGSGNSPTAATAMNASTLSMKPELIIGRMKSTSEKMSKIRVRLDTGRAQWVVETDDAAIKKIAMRHRKKGKVEGKMVENSNTTTTVRVKKVSSPLHEARVGKSLSPSRAAELLSTSKTFGAIAKLPPSLIAQTLPLRKAEAALSRSLKEMQRSDSPEAAERNKHRKKKKGKSDIMSKSAAQLRIRSNNNNNLLEDANDEEQFDEMGIYSPKAGAPLTIRRAHTSGHSFEDGRGRGSGAVKLPGIKRNVVSS